MFTSQFICEALGLEQSPENANAPSFTKITTDSRQITPGCLFVALPGEKFDGHTFLESAAKQGATGFVCKKGFAPSAPLKELHYFEVPDTTEAFRQLANHWRRRFSIPVIAVAGSNGKTTTKELLAAILSGKFKKVLKTTGSQNGFVGIPLTLIELRPDHDIAVIEVGIDEMGAMSKHLSIVNPTVSVLTSIGPEHLEKLHDVKTVAFQEGIALTYVAEKRGHIALHLDDPWIRPYGLSVHREKMIPFTLSSPQSAAFASVLRDFGLRAEQILVGSISEDKTTLTCTGRGFKQESFPLPLPGDHNASNLLAAIAVATSVDLNPDEIRKGLSTFKAAEGRSELKHLPGETSVICDYYNANPASMEAALELLHQVSSRTKCTNWACLGDMLEQGEQEELFHRALATKIEALGIQNVLLYGPRMQWLYAELQSRKSKTSVSYFKSHSELTAFLIQNAQPGDCFLIKGSRGMKMEEIWKPLSQHALAHWTHAHGKETP